MGPIPKLNDGVARPTRWLALGIVLSVGLLYRQLAAIHARPATLPMSSPATVLPRREDADLFEQALTAGLLRQDADGQIAIAPADLPLRQSYQREHPEWLTPRHAEPDWLDRPWDDTSRRLHRALHFSLAGRYVRQQIAIFNARHSGPLGNRRLRWVGTGVVEIERDD